MTTQLTTESFTVKVTSAGNGSAAVDKSTAFAGDVTITNNQFTMPAKNVEIQAVFEAIPVTPEETKPDENKPGEPESSEPAIYDNDSDSSDDSGINTEDSKSPAIAPTASPTVAPTAVPDNSGVTNTNRVDSRSESLAIDKAAADDTTQSGSAPGTGDSSHAILWLMDLLSAITVLSVAFTGLEIKR